MKVDKTKLGYFDRTIDGCQVTAIPAGTTPKFISVKLPGDDEAIVGAWWRGFPAGLAVNDYVEVRHTPKNQPQYVITGTSAGTGTASVILADVIEDLGDLIVGTGPAAVDNLAVGADGYVLTADSGEPLGVKWGPAGGGGIPETLIDAKGDLIVGAADDDADRLAVGLDEMTLLADSGETLGVKWAYPYRIYNGDGTLLGEGTFTLSTYWLLMYYQIWAAGIRVQAATQILFEDDGSIPPLNITARSSAPGTPATGDIYLDTGANTATGAAGFRRYNGSAWVDIGPAAASETVAGIAEIATPAETDTGTDDARIVTPLKLATAKFQTAFQGHATNYVITPSVSSNNLTVALKTIAGGDPSASDPITVRIGDALQTITAALSVTKNAGTNWCNSGGAELATKEIDYFVYLIQETGASAGTKIGFSRIPYGRTVGDFSSTTTNEKYLAGPTNYNSTDAVALIGRFAATLSATASFNWSAPGTVVNRPIFETRWLTYAAQVTASSGSLTTVGTVTTTYQVVGSSLYFSHNVTITTNGTGAGQLRVTLPFTPASVGVTAGKENGLTGKELLGNSNTNFIAYVFYDGTYPGGNGAVILGGGIALRLV